ncbi:Bug family tripartite tricarboxylate transporter substrate binding protein [Humitalea sp. 24SJ18S-53]|uniref:Bug family tripartite tricarboxylate transporter substrate binding protein n=1 Tax=Humitalea sp. 24SJ18S-53 TaxID=3422307 RepID=UPI003D677D79
MFPRRTILAASLSAPAILSPFGARAQDTYPNKAIRVVVGFAAGGSTDLNTRTMAPKLGQLLGQPVVVDNRPGAGGNLATEIVARANPDGYTLLMGTIAALSVNPSLYRNLPFDPQTDVTPISMAGNVLNVLVVPMDRPWRSTADLIAAARARPETITYGSSGVGGAGHLSGALLDRLAGVKTIHVPYRGGGPLMTDLISGKLDFAFSTGPTALPQVEGGRLRMLAVPSAARSPLLPDVPTVAESLPGFDVQNWNALVGPKNLPRAIVDRLNAAMRTTLQDPEVVHHLGRHGVEPLPSSPEDLARFIREETAKWAPILRDAGVSPD